MDFRRGRLLRVLGFAMKRSVCGTATVLFAIGCGSSDTPVDDHHGQSGRGDTTYVDCEVQYTLTAGAGGTQSVQTTNTPGLPPCIPPETDPSPSCADACSRIVPNARYSVTSCNVTPKTYPNKCNDPLG